MEMKRTNILIKPDCRRVVLRPFEPYYKNQAKIITRIMALSDDEVENEIQRILKTFENRHRQLCQFFRKRFNQIQSDFLDNEKISDNRKLLIGAYFTNEYSVEAVALFNPSLVWHPDQKNMSHDAKRFIMILRATGEGHISSITFRTGSIDKNMRIEMDDVTRYITSPEIVVCNTDQANYEVRFAEDVNLCERVIYPISAAESNGMEDARFVQFTNEDGSQVYYATYTAYNGHVISLQLLETADFINFKFNKLNGPAIQNKGMALFPRQINGKYAMLSRPDNENNYIMFSDDLHFWSSKQILTEPAYPWELVQLGNCGSPIETEAGWLVLTHGVGPMRQYSIGAFLLDLNDPTRVIGRLKTPLLTSNENEREGYVPNVVYSCGSLIYNHHLILPYAMSDFASSIAYVNFDVLLNELTSHLNKEEKHADN
jgi:predicted GH43/DUF377 family glycosyl hydrolase